MFRTWNPGPVALPISIRVHRMPEYLHPPALRPGDKVGVIAPSFPTAVWFPRRLDVSLQALRDTFQLEPVLAPHVHDACGYQSGSIAARASELQAFLEDPDIPAIFTTLGGFNSNEMLPLLDFAALADRPKILIGYSDTTALLLALTSVSRWVTFSGPALMPQIGEYPGPQPFTLAQMRKLLMEDSAGLLFPDSTHRTDEFLDWAKEEAYSQARRMEPNPGREVWQTGTAEGTLFGGNLETLNFLVGTQWLDLPDEVILYVEATEAEAYLPRFQRALVHLRQAGLFEHVRGLLIGQCPDAKPVAGQNLRDMIRSTIADAALPIVGELSFGHIDPMLTLPNGCRARLEARDDGADLLLLESAVVVDRGAGHTSNAR